ncbi:hypothetical protein DGWBC_1324 [Dehalogenimonas sp. WBC-2]|nr:hypothetical protein DGWBC_1324 [Dehalogenimonas sp. WBC-2]
MGKRSKKFQAQKRALRQATRKVINQPSVEPSVNKTDVSRKPKVFFVVTSVLLFIAQNFWGGSVLASLSFKTGYALFLLSNTFILGWWAWLLAGMFYRSINYAKRLKALVVILIVVVVFFTSPHYVGFFVKAQSTIQFPPYTLDSTQVLVSYGNRHDSEGFQTGDAITTIGELKYNPFVSLKINGQSIFEINVTEQREIAIDTKLFTGFYDQSKHIFNRPIIVTGNEPDYLPDGWYLYRNADSIEIVNRDGIPVLVMEYKKPNRVIISGLFVTPMGICKVDNEQKQLYILGDNMEQLGTFYKVDIVTIHSPFDLFRSERTYDLSKWRD